MPTSAPAIPPLVLTETSASGHLATSPAGAPKSRRAALILAMGVVLLAFVVWAFQWWTVERFIESTDNAYLKADSVVIAPKVSGYISTVYVQDNQAVEKGQPLALVDQRQYQAALDEAKATVAARQADVVRSEAELSLQKSKIAQAKADVDGVRASASYASSQVNRYSSIVKSGAVTGERFDELRNILVRATSSVAANEAAWQTAKNQTQTLEARLLQAQAQQAVAQAKAERAKLDLQDTVVRSTLSGRVADQTVRAGQYAQPGSRLLTIVPVGNLYLTANFKETQVGHMRPGQAVTIHVDAYPGEIFHGVVESLSPGTGSQFALLPAQNATGNFTKIVQRVSVRIHLDEQFPSRAVLIPGLSTTVEVDTKPTSGVSGERLAGDRRG